MQLEHTNKWPTIRGSHLQMETPATGLETRDHEETPYETGLGDIKMGVSNDKSKVKEFLRK